MGEQLSWFSFIHEWIFSNAGRCHRKWCYEKHPQIPIPKLVHAMAFMSIGEILKNIKSLWNFVEMKLFAEAQGHFTNRVCGLFSSSIRSQLLVHRPMMTWCCHVQPCSLLIPTLPSWLGFPAWPLTHLVTRDLSGHQRTVGQTCSSASLGYHGTVACHWWCCPVCLAVTLSSWLTVPWGAASPHYSLTQRLNLTQVCCLASVSIIL